MIVNIQHLLKIAWKHLSVLLFIKSINMPTSMLQMKWPYKILNLKERPNMHSIQIVAYKFVNFQWLYAPMTLLQIPSLQFHLPFRLNTAVLKHKPLRSVILQRTLDVKEILIPKSISLFMVKLPHNVTLHSLWCTHSTQCTLKV